MHELPGMMPESTSCLGSLWEKTGLGIFSRVMLMSPKSKMMGGNYHHKIMSQRDVDIRTKIITLKNQAE